MNITIDNLKKIMPQARTQMLEMFLIELNVQLPNYSINTPLRVSAFLSQGAYECGEFRELIEIMYYTTSERLQKVWPKRFPTVQCTLPYLRNPEKLGNKVYANRLGNGSEESGDGFKYRGRGWFNSTGKDDYIKMTNLTNHDFISKPDDLIIPRFAIQSACIEWQDKKLNKYADIEDYATITKKINGALTGFDGRMIYYLRAKQTFGIDT